PRLRNRAATVSGSFRSWFRSSTAVGVRSVDRVYQGAPGPPRRRGRPNAAAAARSDRRPARDRSFRDRSAFPLLPPRFAPSSFASRGPIERAQRRELLADAQLESPVDRNVEALRLDAVGEIALTGRIAAG